MVIDGKQLASTMRQHIADRVRNLNSVPVLCDVTVGEDPVSLSFVRIKQHAAAEVGMEFRLVQLPASTTLDAVVTTIIEQQQDSRLCGLIVQLPLPEQFPAETILGAISLKVDVDVISPRGLKLLYAGELHTIPPTAGAIMYILQSLPIDLTNEKILIIGQGNLVGKPVTHLLRKLGLPVQIADEFTSNTDQLMRDATIIISGVGKPDLITAAHVQAGVIVIDAGTSESSGTITGDVDFEAVAAKARYITPVPGGVGPVTVAKLLENVVQSAEAITHR